MTGFVITFAGKVGACNRRNGYNSSEAVFGYEANFRGPTGLNFDIYGNLLVADYQWVRNVTFKNTVYVERIAGKPPTASDGSIGNACC